MKNNGTVYILLPVHNRREITQILIVGLAKQTYPNIHLVLIDDGCNDGTVEMVKGYFPNCTVLEGKGRWWWGGSLHQGYRWIKKNGFHREDTVLLINDDTEVEKDFVEKGVRLTKSSRRTLVQAQAVSAEGGIVLERGVVVDWRWFNFRQAEHQEEINCLSTRGLFIRIEDFVRLGGFHPFLLPHYGSDYEYTIRAYRRGYRLVSTSEVKLVMNRETTGVRQMTPAPLTVLLKKLLSKRTPLNPIYLSVFVIFSSPARHVFRNLVRIWVSFFYRIGRLSTGVL